MGPKKMGRACAVFLWLKLRFSYLLEAIRCSWKGLISRDRQSPNKRFLPGTGGNRAAGQHLVTGVAEGIETIRLISQSPGRDSDCNGVCPGKQAKNSWLMRRAKCTAKASLKETGWARGVLSSNRNTAAQEDRILEERGREAVDDQARGFEMRQRVAWQGWDRNMPKDADRSWARRER